MRPAHSTGPGAAAGATEAPFAAFGVFDGHGGKFASAHAAKHLLESVMAAVDRDGPEPARPVPAGADAPEERAEGAARGGGGVGRARAAPGAWQAAVPEEASARARALWRLHDELLDRLPQARGLAPTRAPAEAPAPPCRTAALGHNAHPAAAGRRTLALSRPPPGPPPLCCSTRVQGGRETFQHGNHDAPLLASPGQLLPGPRGACVERHRGWRPAIPRRAAPRPRRRGR